MTVPMPLSDMVEREVRIAARPEIIFPFFTDATKLLRWKGIEAEVEARPGGLLRLNLNGRDVMRGEYVEITPHERVVFTWGWEQGGAAEVPPGASLVEVRLVPDGDYTVVRLRHSGLASAELQHSHLVGWDYYLPRLSIVARGGDSPRDVWAETGRMSE